MPGNNSVNDAAAKAAACGGGGDAGPSADRSTAELNSKASGLAPVVTSQPPLPFSSWFALQSYTTDLLLLLLDLIVIVPPYVAQQWANRQCVPLAGAPHAALQTLPLDTAHYRADRLAARFPCGASYTEQLAYTVVTGAAFDPWVRIRAGDWGNLLYVCLLLLTIFIALVYPRIYMRCRWPLFAANAVALLSGHAVAAVTVSLPMLALIGPSFYGSFRRRVGVLHSAWRSLVVLRVSRRLSIPLCCPLLTRTTTTTKVYAPSPKTVKVDRPSPGAPMPASPSPQVPLPQQLALALPLWLLTAFIAHTADRRLPPAAASVPTVPPLPQPIAELLASFLVVAVLPCVVAYLLDSCLLRPHYAAYLLRQGQQQQQPPRGRQQAQEERRQGQQHLPVCRSPRPGGKAWEGDDEASSVNGSHVVSQCTGDEPSPHSHTAASPGLCTPLSPDTSIASPTGGRGALDGSEAGGGGVLGQEASAATEPAATPAAPSAHDPTQPAATMSAASPHPRCADARWGGCGSATTTAAACRLSSRSTGHTRAPMQRRPTLDIALRLDLSEPQASPSSPHGPPSRRPFPPPRSTHNQTPPPSAAAAAAPAAIASVATSSAHLGPVATGYSSAAASTRSSSCSSSLYRQACPMGQVHTLSVKVPLRHHAGAGACRVPVRARRPHFGCCIVLIGHRRLGTSFHIDGLATLGHIRMLSLQSHACKQLRAGS